MTEKWTQSAYLIKINVTVSNIEPDALMDSIGFHLLWRVLE